MTAVGAAPVHADVTPSSVGASVPAGRAEPTWDRSARLRRGTVSGARHFTFWQRGPWCEVLAATAGPSSRSTDEVVERSSSPGDRHATAVVRGSSVTTGGLAPGCIRAGKNRMSLRCLRSSHSWIQMACGDEVDVDLRQRRPRQPSPQTVPSPVVAPGSRFSGRVFCKPFQVEQLPASHDEVADG